MNYIKLKLKLIYNYRLYMNNNLNNLVNKSKSITPYNKNIIKSEDYVKAEKVLTNITEIGGWKVSATGIPLTESYDLVAEEVNQITGKVISPKYSLIKPIFGPTGSIGATGATGSIGATGPTGSLGITGQNYSDYIYWDGNNWAVGSSQVHIGSNAGYQNQGFRSVAIGDYAGAYLQAAETVAVGTSAGYLSQGTQAIALGNQAGYINQGTNAVAIGHEAGRSNQGPRAIAIGLEAGYTGQELGTIAIGGNAGRTNQQQYAAAIGFGAGFNGQENYALAIGYGAGYLSQKNHSVALGTKAGYTTQGSYSVALGAYAGYTNQPANSIVINASGVVLNPGNSGFYVSPIGSTGSTGPVLIYDTTSKEIKYSTSKSFIIDHPDDSNKYLIHGCLEGPEAGVYYRGQGEITNNKYVLINLPNYVKNLATNFSIQITPIEEFDLDEKEEEQIIKYYSVSKVKNNSFKVYGKNGTFYWHVYGQRFSIEIEPNKCDVNVAGDGPYKYIVK
jgi:hypothetical protein